MRVAAMTAQYFMGVDNKQTKKRERRIDNKKIRERVRGFELFLDVGICI